MRIAGAYCNLIDSCENMSKEEFVRAIGKTLGKLFAAAIELLEVRIDVSEHYEAMTMSHDDWSKLFSSLRKKLGDDDGYWIVFDPYNEEAPVFTSLSDDLSDIYRDLRSGLDAFGKSERDSHEAVWIWQFGFQGHWGHHCSCAMRPISKLLEAMDE